MPGPARPESSWELTWRVRPAVYDVHPLLGPLVLVHRQCCQVLHYVHPLKHTTKRHCTCRGGGGGGGREGAGHRGGGGGEREGQAGRLRAGGQERVGGVERHHEARTQRNVLGSGVLMRCGGVHVGSWIGTGRQGGRSPTAALHAVGA